MRNFTQRHQALTFSLLFLVVFIFERWLTPLDLPWFVWTPERINLLGDLIISLMLTLLIWIPIYGYQRVETNTAILTKTFNNEVWLYLKRPQKPGRMLPQLPANTTNNGWFIIFPFFQTVLAVMPDYQFTFEFPIESIDTQTPRLARITKIMVRVVCEITDHRAFFFESGAFFERIRQLEAEEQLHHTSSTLWETMLKELVQVRIDDGIRDVVWRWHEHLNHNPALMMEPAFTPTTPSELDPYDLSVNRNKLAQHVLHEIKNLTMEKGYRITSLVFESIEIDPELIKRKTRNKTGEIAEAEHDARKSAELIKAKGLAEASVRAQTLALLLEELISKHDVKIQDNMVAEIVRAALYSDGEMIWNATLRDGVSADGNAKTA